MSKKKMNKPDLSSDELSDEDIWSTIESYFEEQHLTRCS